MATDFVPVTKQGVMGSAKVKEVHDVVESGSAKVRAVRQPLADGTQGSQSTSIDVSEMSGLTNGQHDVDMLVAEPVWTWKELQEEQCSVAGMKTLISAVEKGTGKPSWEEICAFSPEVKMCWAAFDHLRIRNGVLYRLFETPDGLRVRWPMFLPQNAGSWCCMDYTQQNLVVTWEWRSHFLS